MRRPRISPRLATVLGTAALVAAAGCSQILGLQDPTPAGDGGPPDTAVVDTPPGTPDAPPGTPDAPPGTPDAFIPDAPMVSDFGKVCSMDSDCTTPTTNCIQVQTGGTLFCTLSCGTSTDQTMPPADGNAICQSAYGTSQPGQPACALYTPDPNVSGQYIWYCAIFCPAGDSCPAGLTCDAMNQVCT